MKYTKKQIQEAIQYWSNRLEKMNEAEELPIDRIHDVLVKAGFDVKGVYDNQTVLIDFHDQPMAGIEQKINQALVTAGFSADNAEVFDIYELKSGDYTVTFDGDIFPDAEEFAD